MLRCGSWCHFLFGNLLAEEESCAVAALPHGAVGWYVVSDCAISWPYSLAFVTHWSIVFHFRCLTIL